MKYFSEQTVEIILNKEKSCDREDNINNICINEFTSPQSLLDGFIIQLIISRQTRDTPGQVEDFQTKKNP